MVEAVYLGNLVPLIFLYLVSTGDMKKLVLSFSWGLTAALIMYLVSDTVISVLDFSETMGITLVFPGIEELLKALPFLVLPFLQGKNRKYSITRLALASGIGFSILENYLYLSEYAPADFSGQILFIIIRSLTACVLHGSATALVGWGAQQMRDLKRFTLALPAGLLLTAWFFHSIYNYLGLHPMLRFLTFSIPLILFGLEFFLFNFFGYYRSKSTITGTAPVTREEP